MSSVTAIYGWLMDETKVSRYSKSIFRELNMSQIQLQYENVLLALNSVKQTKMASPF